MKNKGFTLIEVAIALAIVAILAAIGFPILNRYNSVYQVTCKDRNNVVIMERQIKGFVIIDDHAVSSANGDYQYSIPFDVACEKYRLN